MSNKNKKIPTMPINKTQKRLYAGSSDPTFEHETLEAMEQYLNNPTAYMGQMMYCKENDTHYSISKNEEDQKILKEIGSGQSGNLKIVETLDERDAIEDVTYGLMCYVIEEGVYFSYRRGLEEEGEKDGWEPFKGAGGGSAIGTLVSKMDGTTQSVSVGEPLVVDLSFSTPNIGPGNLYVIADGSQILKQQIRMGAHNISIDLEKGSYNLQIYVVDRGGVHTNTVLITVQCGGLEITPNFDWKEDYPINSFITVPYEIDTISKEPIKVYFKIDNKVYEQDAENGYNEYEFPELGVGAHSVEIWAVSGTFESNKIKETLVILGSESLYVSSLFDLTEAEEGDQLIIDYRISMQNEKLFDVDYIVDEKPYKKSTGNSGANTFLISDLPKGPHTIIIKVTTKDGLHTAQVEINIEIKESSYQLQQPITQGLLAHFDAFGLNNSEIEKNIWRDKTGRYTGTLHNFNFSSNGWIENGLRLNGSAYAVIDLRPFEPNALTGLTIDIEFETEDVGNENARVLDCTNTLESAIGCYISTSTASIKSDSSVIEASFAERERTRITYVIDRLNKITKLYINAVLCNVSILKDSGTGNDKVLENFKHEERIYLNSEKGLSNFGACTVYNLRVYNRALKSADILQNHIADIKDKEVQKKKWDFNHKDTIPTMYFEGDVSAMTKANAVPLRIRYVSTNETLYGKSFDLPKCPVKWQGTSSLDYAVKNYKIKLMDETGEKKFKHALRENMIEESTFVLKADYMESSHANNTGLAKIVNRYLYDTPLPPQEKDKRVVSAIDGFPVKLYVNEKLYGIFNFNLDKGNDKSFGFDLKKYPKCMSYEVRANTDTTAGAFYKWTEERGQETGKATELEYLQADFELRFPDEDDEGIGKDYGYLTELKELIDWVDDADEDTFKRDFEKHFNKEYTLRYYLFVLTMGMVDNLGKNMMLNTWDGKIWYPCFYDLDTALALDNTGYLRFDIDIEMTDEGVFNTSGSKLWTKVANCFKEEIKAMYVKMRTNKFKEKNIFGVLIDEQIDQIPELLYNEDSQKKYIDHSQYIHMLHGSRREHMRKWLTERLLYLDSKLGYEEHTKENITVRANKLGEVYFDIKTYSPMYITVRWRSGTEETKKVERGKATRFTGTLPVETDQEILVYGAKHLKELGDLTHMNPTALLIGDATRLTKLICKNSPKLKSLGIGNTSVGGAGLKNLQELDLTGCSALGTVTGSNGIDLSNCENLKVARLQGTSYKNIKFNPKGGNLEEIHLPNSLTSLHLVNEYRLRTIRFPAYSRSHRMDMVGAFKDGSKITNLTIENCPNLISFGLPDTSISASYLSTELLNYRGGVIKTQSDKFDISKDEYIKAFKLGGLGRLEKVKISNSLLGWQYICINASPNLVSATFEYMPELKGVILTGNKNYGATGGVREDNFESDPAFENIYVYKCPNFDSLIIQAAIDPNNHRFAAYKFKKDFEWDLSHLRLKKFICNIPLQNLKKIVLPDTIDEFSHSRTKLFPGYETAADGSKSQYTKEMSPLETVIIAGRHTDDNFKGVDLENILINEFSLAGLTQKVDIIQNINCKAINLKPVWVSEHIINGNVDATQEMKNITVDLNEYKGNSLENFCRGADLSNFTVKLDQPLTTENMDYSWMFFKARNGVWDNLGWIKKLPPGKISRTFENADIDKLEVGHMIGPATTELYRCFALMKNVKEIDLRGADTSNITMWNFTFPWITSIVRINLEGLDFTNNKSWSSAFKECPNLEQIINVSNLIQEKCGAVDGMFNNTPKLKFDFPKGKPNWRFGATSQPTIGFFSGCGIDVVLGVNEEYILDLSDCGKFYNGSVGSMFSNTGFTKIILGDMTGSIFGFNENKRLKELDLSRIEEITNNMYFFARLNPELITLDMRNMDMKAVTLTDYSFGHSPKLTNLYFGKGLKCSISFADNINLTEASLLSILENIGNANSGAILTLGKTNLAKLTDDQKKKATDKGWTLA